MSLRWRLMNDQTHLPVLDLNGIDARSPDFVVTTLEP